MKIRATIEVEYEVDSAAYCYVDLPESILSFERSLFIRKIVVIFPPDSEIIMKMEEIK